MKPETFDLHVGAITRASAIQRAKWFLVDQAKHEIRLNEATGHQMDPTLPRREVFERPGWKWMECQGPVMRTVEAELGPLLSSPDDHPAQQVPIKERTISARWAVKVKYQEQVRVTVGLAIDVDLRRYILFHW